MRLKGVHRAAVAVVPLLGLVACQSGGGASGTAEPAAESVYDKKLADQLRASRKATEESGSARFTLTLTYRTKHGTAEDRTTGAQDYGKKTADAVRTVTVPREVSQETAALLGGRPGDRVQQTFEVTGNTVAYRTERGGWLRYTSSGSLAFTEKAGAVLSRSGDRVPYGGTLADVVAGADDPKKQPAVDQDGNRRYEVVAAARRAAEVFPGDLGVSVLTGKGQSGAIPLTIRLDKEGRLTEATADYAPVLSALHKDGVLKDVTELRAAYTLTDFGKAAPQQTASAAAGTVDAEKALTPLHDVKPGTCASQDTGLGSASLVRVIGCAGRFDLRVFGQVTVDKTTKAELTYEDGYTEARNKCRSAFGKAPSAWTAKAEPRDTFLIDGDPNLSMSYSPGGDNRISGDFTCYVTTARS
ncbi:hypothetical protein [Streptomyces vilmorinianum]|uniref:hypothetical protein n=1 Tax=Streptomyces vilmorinianum TaxID=3051092 RepID=UPI0015867428|nr:hypothetical protein [Streptomyces vilmorinianum]